MNIHALPKNNKYDVGSLVRNKLLSELVPIVMGYIASGDSNTFIISFNMHSILMSVEQIDLRWGYFYDGAPYRDASLKGVVLRYWRDSAASIPISSLSGVASSHTVTSVDVTQRINNNDNGGHNGTCMGGFYGMFCPYTAQKKHLPHINDGR
jgi:hypothetical protein